MIRVFRLFPAGIPGHYAGGGPVSMEFGMAAFLRSMVLLAFVGAGLAATPVIAEDAPLEDVAKVPVSVHKVLTGGHWSVDGAEGAYRAVVTSADREHTKHQIFLQWLKRDPDNGAYEVIRTDAVDKINADDCFVLNARMDFTIEGQFRVYLRARLQGKDADDNFLIVAKPAGGYTVIDRN